MFNNMKNKIREKTGTEIPKFVPNSKLSVSSSQHGSESSLNSLSCPITDINSNSGAIIVSIEKLKNFTWSISIVCRDMCNYLEICGTGTNICRIDRL